MDYYVENMLAETMPACTEIFRSVFSMPPWSETWKYNDAFQRLNDIFNTNNSICLCCYFEEEIVGCLFGVLYKWHSGYQFEIKEFFVNEKLQGKGIGKAILSELEKILDEKKPVDIFLQTLAHKDTICFYESQEYVIKENYRKRQSKQHLPKQDGIVRKYPKGLEKLTVSFSRGMS